MEEEETQLKDAESVEDMDEQTVQLKALGINVVDQSDLEQSVEAVVEKAAAKHVRKQRLQILKKDVKNGHLEILKLKKKKSDVDFKISGMRQRLVDPRKFVEAENTLKSIKAEIETHSNRIRYIEDKLKLAEEDESVIDDVDIGLEEGEIVDEGPEEEFSALDKEKMIKSGAMTPFGTLMSSGSAESKSDEPSVPPFELGDTRDSMKVEEMKNGETSSKNIPQKNNSSVNNEFEKYIQDQMAKQNLYSRNESIKPKSSAGSFGKHKQSRKRLKEFQPIPSSSEPITKRRKKSSGTPKNNTLKYSSDTEDESFKPEDLSDQDPSGSDYVPSEDSDEDLTCVVSKESDKLALKNKKTSVKKKFKKITDDGHVKSYIRRIHSWKKKRLKEKHRKILEGESEDEEEEFERFERGYKIPLSIWNKLFKYQRTCVKWLWELNCQKCGGILGDEMGLGKTVMVISYLAGLSFSGLMSPCRRFRGLGPVLIVCPVTVLQQWLRELHKWWPMFRVAVLHESGSFTGKRPSLIHCINKNNGILITSYQGVISQIKSLLNYDWHYVILDEGHKIRNPEAQITVALKRFDTPHRIILSGSPIQNSLKELWSLFDFVFPGKLGTLPVFMQQFAVPITQGGYANANKLEVQTAFRCATVLRDTINPYLLRRMKNDVRDHLSLPNKSEQVLFCDLTEEQRRTYRQYLDSKEVSSIMSGRLQVFVGLINLRKICNHPDLYDGGMRILDQEASNSLQPEMEFGWYKRSGKMMVLEAILKLWKKQGHRVLLFSQSRQMISILEKFLISRSYSYLKMDGTTSISSRQPLIQRFNEDASHFVFLLTTRVGGLGVNLIGADRVVIYDPDWNPSTDTQARERAWRIGQTRQVTIYRLLTAGTIEEKIYHRQIFKQFITNKVLKDPKQQRFFKSNDLFELFTLSEGKKEKTESSAIFAGIGSEIKFKKNKSRTEGTETVESLSEEVEKTKSQARTAVAKAKIPKTKAVMHKPKTGTPRKVAEPSNPNAEIIFQKAEPFKLKSEVPLQKSESIELNGEVPNQNTETLDQKSDVSIKVEVPDSVTEMANSQIVQTETTLPEDETINKVYPVPSCSKESNVDGTEILQNGFSDKSEPENSLGSSENNAESENRCDNDLKIELNKSNIDEDERTRIMREKARLLSKKISQMKFKTNQKDSSESTRKKKKKGKKFEGERIQGLLKVRQFKYTKDDTENESKSDKSHDEEVLRELFKKTSVHSAFSHDVIVNSSDPDYLLLQTEADRVAKEALRQVRLSRARCSRFKNKPDTSKKKFGVKRSSVLQDDDSGSTSKKETLRNNDEEDDKKAPKILQEQIGSTSDRTEVNGSTSGALSSAELLKRMKERNKTKPNIPTSTNSSRFTSPRFSRMDESSSDSDESCPDISEDPEIQPHVELLTDIRNFIAFQAEVDGQATTKEVIHKFRDRLPPSQNHIFKALLKEICDFVRDSAGHGVWYIKGEFR